MIVADIIETFINSITFKGNVISCVLDGVNTVLTVENALFSREGLSISIDGTDTTIVSATFSECSTDTITVSGSFADCSEFVLQDPVYLHGTPYATNSHLSRARMAGERITPLIYLLEVLETRDDGRQSETVSADIRLFFVDDANVADWLTDDHYTEVITQMNRLADYVIAKAQEYSGFSHDFAVRGYSHANWGQYADLKGYIQRIFNVNLSGVERRLNLPILKDCNC